MAYLIQDLRYIWGRAEWLARGSLVAEMEFVGSAEDLGDEEDMAGVSDELENVILEGSTEKSRKDILRDFERAI